MKILCHKILAVFLILLAILALVGCGGGRRRRKPPVIPVITFTAAPSVIMTGGSSVLAWSVTGTQQVQSPDFTVTGATGQVTVNPTVTTTYTLTATGSRGQVSAQVTIVVVEPGKVAFISSRSGSDQLYLMNSDGTGLQLIEAAGTGIMDPSLSPDGSKIAYASNQNGNADIYIVNADGSGAPQRITTNTADDKQPVWSRNGDLLAWTREANETYANDTIMVKPVLGGAEQEFLTEARNPYFNPNGDQLAFTSLNLGAESIYYISLTGGAPTQVLTLPDANLIIDHLSWSKNGKIAFSSYDSSQASVKGSIYKVDAVVGGIPGVLITNDWDNCGPSWAPSGNQLVFYSNRDGNYAIYVADADGANQTRLTTGSADDGLPVWSQSFRWLRVHRSKTP